MRSPGTLAAAAAGLALAAWTVPGAARQASNFNVTAAEAAAHDCGSECQRILGLTNPADLDVVGHDFDFGFYATASNMSANSSRPGDVLKLQPIDWEAEGRTYRDGTAAFRFQYVTVDLDGSLVPATGFIAFPYAPGMASFGGGGGNGTNGTAGGGNGNRTTGGGGDDDEGTFKLVAWAHGTIGVFAGCAPSNGPNMFDYDSWQPLTARGYAVVATDYAGLGNNATSHKYCSFTAHATDVYYSVVAARRLFGARLSRRWLSVGHSQGGGTAWKLAESDFVRNDSSYLGTVALSPATYVVDMLLGELAGGNGSVPRPGSGSGSGSGSGNGSSSSGSGSGNDTSTSPFPGYVPYLPLAVERAVPTYRETLLSASMRERLGLAVDKQMCTNAFMGLTFDLWASGAALINGSGLAHDAPSMLEWQAQQAPALGARSPAPVLVVQGTADSSVLAPTTERAWRASCGHGNDVHLSLYPGIEHSPLPAAAEAEWMGWIDWRFAGGRYPSTAGRCSRVTRRAFGGPRWTKMSPEFRLDEFLGNGTDASRRRRR